MIYDYYNYFPFLMFLMLQLMQDGFFHGQQEPKHEVLLSFSDPSEYDLDEYDLSLELDDPTDDELDWEPSDDELDELCPFSCFHCEIKINLDKLEMIIILIIYYNSPLLSWSNLFSLWTSSLDWPSYTSQNFTI